MLVGRGENERGMGENRGLTYLSMGSGHSEKGRGGVQGFPCSQFPNGEAGGTTVGPDSGEAKRQGASERGGNLG